MTNDHVGPAFNSPEFDPELVEAVARALFDVDYGPQKGWDDDCAEYGKKLYKDRAEFALTAAYSHSTGVTFTVRIDGVYAGRYGTREAARARAEDLNRGKHEPLPITIDYEFTIKAGHITLLEDQQ